METAAINIRHLEALAAIVAHGSVTAAARQINLTQPAITQGIAKLEALIGLPLFERRSSGMVPTPAGRLFAPRAVAALLLIGRRPVTATQIHAFLALARRGSYGAAAAETGLSQASLHRAVGDLALNLEQRLVERRGKGIALTARGLAVARNFRLANAELHAALSEIAALQGREIGRIVVGAMPLSRARLLPAAVAAFHARHPEVDIAVVEGSHAELIGPLRDGEIDMTIGALRDPLPSADVAQLPLFEDRPVIVGRAGHPLALAGRMRSSDLARYPWIVAGSGTPLRRQWEAMFASAGIRPPRVPIESGSVMMVRQMMMNSDFLTLLSIDQVAVELEAGWLVKIGDAPGNIRRTIGVTTRADWRPTALQQRFVDMLVDHGRALMAERDYS